MQLKGLRVIELASVLAGPAVGMFFAELGATVIKIENKRTGGDVTRSWKLPTESDTADYSAYYCSVNWGKKVEMLDLSQGKDRAEVHEMVRGADIVISNFRPASAERIGMDYTTLSHLNPRLIYAQLTGFGPDDARPAFDVVLQAETGFLQMTGSPDGPPVKMPVALIDLLAAHQLKEGILLALFERERTGKGCFLQTSLFDAAIASLANQATNWLMAGHIPQRMGCRHPNIAPYGDLFETKDGRQLVLAVGTEQQFRQLCACLELEILSEDPRFAQNADRVKHREALVQLLQPAFLRKNLDEWMLCFQEQGVPAGRLRQLDEVFELDTAQNMILEEEGSDGKLTRRVKTFTVHWS